MEGRPLEQPGESVLVERARRGDQDAYGELVTRYQALAARVAYVITASPVEAEDVTQDAFVKAYYALDRFREGAPFRPWLLRIVANEAKNRKAAAGRRPTVELTAAADRASGETALSPEDAAVAADLRTRLLAAINRLREEDRLVLSMDDRLVGLVLHGPVPDHIPDYSEFPGGGLVAGSRPDAESR